MDLLSYSQILHNLRRTAEMGYISKLNKKQIEELALKYFGIKDSNGKYVGYMCPYSGKIYSKKSNLVLEHIISVDSKGGTVLFNCIPTSREVNGKNEKWKHHLIKWWTNSKYWDIDAPKRLQNLVNYMLEAYAIVFKEYSVEEIEESYQEVLENEDDLTISKRKKEKTNEQTQNNDIHSYLGFLLDCIKQLEKENINTTEINIKLKELEEKNIFKDIERYTLFQNILKQVIIKFTGNDTKSYLTYSIKFDIKKLMDSIPYNNEQEIYNEIYSRILNIQELLAQNNLVIEEYFNSLNNLDYINIIYKSRQTIKKGEIEEFLLNINLGIDTKISEYIELLNRGYIPKSIDKEIQFSNDELINYFWQHHKEKIKERLNVDKKYKEGYEIAKQAINAYENPIDKISEYIELLNLGYIPKYNDEIKTFSNGDLIKTFLSNNKEKIKERLNVDKKYKEGYEIAKQAINAYENPLDKISEYIELLNQGYVPKAYDNERKFSNGESINYFWSSSNNKENIIIRLNTDKKYKEGYEIAKQTIYEIENPFDKISEYIELLNLGYIPKYNDEIKTFSNGDLIKYFWSNNKEKIKERLNTDKKYKEGYEIAKQAINAYENPIDKISEYIELLNRGYIPKSIDKEIQFSNGELINYFWSDNKKRIKETLQTEKKYQIGYEIAKQAINAYENPFDKISEYIELLNRGYIPKSIDKEIQFSNGDLIISFWPNSKEKIKERLNTDKKYKEGYEIAKKTIYKIENPFDKISEYIELLNKGHVPKSIDKETQFSNGELINYFWSNNKEIIINKLFEELKKNIVFNKARQTILNYLKVNTIEEYFEAEEKKKQLKELRNMKQNLENVDKNLKLNETAIKKRA